MESGETTKYLKYAIGEILLVVIGILIALSINNWNEGRKEAKLAKVYLKGIQNDLQKDFVLLDSIMRQNSREISLFNSLSPVFKEAIYAPDRYSSFFIEPDTTYHKYIFYRGISFRPIRASYNSLVADGKSSLIKNRELFALIQEIYDERHARMASVYETLKPSEDRIHWSYASEKMHWSYTDLKSAADDKIFLDLFNLLEIKFFYNQHLFELRENMTEVVRLIDKELAND